MRVSQSKARLRTVHSSNAAVTLLLCHLDQQKLCGAEDLGLVPNKEGYQVIELEGCDFLLATTADGSFDLSDAYVQVSAAAFIP